MNQAVLTRWRNLLWLKNSIIIPPPPTTRFSLFHSTPPCFGKWSSKLQPDKNGHKPSKRSIETRQRRADAKKSLQDLLNGRCSSKTAFERFQQIEDRDCKQGAPSNRSKKKSHSKSKSSARGTSTTHSKNKRSKSRRDDPFHHFDEHSEPFFQVFFGDRCYTWSWGQSPFQRSTFGSYDSASWTSFGNKQQDTTRGINSDDKSCFLGSCSDRTILGLPVKGPLKIEEVKTAFRLSALKWHPDKHQGPSQAMAGEKFKRCVDAYKSLCNALASI